MLKHSVVFGEGSRMFGAAIIDGVCWWNVDVGPPFPSAAYSPM